MVDATLRPLRARKAPLCAKGLGEARRALLSTALLLAAGCDDGAAGAGGASSSSSAQVTTSVGVTTASASSGAGSSGTGGAEPGSPRFVAVGYGGRRITSADGITWTDDVVVDPNGGDDDNLFRGVGFVDGQFIAVGGAAVGQIATSPDGKTWTFRTPGTSWLADVAPIGATLVTAGGNGLRQRSLDDGVTWIDPAPYYAGHYRGIASGNGIAVAAGHTYGNTNVGLTTTSADGKTWSAEVTGGTPFHSVAFGPVAGGRFVAAGSSRCSTSPDGAAWTDCAGVTGADLDEVVFANGQFIVGNASGYFTSTDGTSFTHVDAEHHAVSVFGAGLYVALDWPDKIFTSPDLTTWTLRNDGTGPAFVEVAFGTLPN